MGIFSSFINAWRLQRASECPVPNDCESCLNHAVWMTLMFLLINGALHAETVDNTFYCGVVRCRNVPKLHLTIKWLTNSVEQFCHEIVFQYKRNFFCAKQNRIINILGFISVGMCNSEFAHMQLISYTPGLPQQKCQNSTSSPPTCMGIQTFETPVLISYN